MLKRWWPIAVWAFLYVVVVGSGLFRNEAMYGLMHADAQGYYGYLVAGVLEQTFDWKVVYAAYADYYGGHPFNFTRETGFGLVNKYYVGTAVLVLPFFLLSCMLAWITGAPIDGYSTPFHLGGMLAAFFYAGLGIMLLVEFLEHKGISRTIAWFVCITCFFATGLFHYAASEPLMSHTYSFFLISGFLLAVQKYAANRRSKHLLLSALAFGMIILVRPSNGTVLAAIPFAIGSWTGLKSTLAGISIKEWVYTALIVTGVVGIQSLMYLLQVGVPLVWSYDGEGFNFSDPQIMNVLFSYRKGLFIYTPWAFLGAIGMVVALFKRTFEAASALVLLALTVYVVSSWWSWYYGGSLGMRALIEYLPFFAYGLAMLIQSVPSAGALVLVLLTLGTVPINLIQSYQYQKFILHWDRMDKERFWKVFLRTDNKYEGIFYREEQVLRLPSAEQILSSEVFETDLEAGSSWGTESIDSTNAFSGSRSARIGKASPFGPTARISVSELGPEGRKQLYISAMVWAEDEFPDLSISYSFKNDSSDYGHKVIGMGQFVLESQQWIQIEHLVGLDEARDTLDDWIVYPYSNDKNGVYIDDLRYEIITLKD